MTDDIWKREDVDSPCVKLCVIDPDSRLCLGCQRTIGEITEWSKMSPAARRAVMEVLPARKEQVRPKRRGGREGRRASSGSASG